MWLTRQPSAWRGENHPHESRGEAADARVAQPRSSVQEVVFPSRVLLRYALEPSEASRRIDDRADLVGVGGWPDRRSLASRSALHVKRAQLKRTNQRARFGDERPTPAGPEQKLLGRAVI